MRLLLCIVYFGGDYVLIKNQLGATRHGINGETWQITRPGEAIHPGDKGMKAIADRVISNFDF